MRKSRSGHGGQQEQVCKSSRGGFSTEMHATGSGLSLLVIRILTADRHHQAEKWIEGSAVGGQSVKRSCSMGNHLVKRVVSTGMAGCVNRQPLHHSAKSPCFPGKPPGFVHRHGMCPVVSTRRDACFSGINVNIERTCVFQKQVVSSKVRV
jgi:hypothetical protein